MIIRRAIAGAAASAVLLALSGSARAASISVASTSDTLAGAGNAATFTGGAGGTLFVPSAPGTAGIPVIITFDAAHSFNATFTFAPITATSGATPIPGGKFAETLSGGSFSFADGGTTYLTGTFSSSVMTAANHGTSIGLASADSNTVTYTGGTFLGLAGITPGTIGAFNFGFSGADSGSGTGTNVSGGFIGPWTANGFSGTFSAFSGSGSNGGGVPEPSGLAGFTIAGLFLGGSLLLRRRRRTSALPA